MHPLFQSNSFVPILGPGKQEYLQKSVIRKSVIRTLSECCEKLLYRLYSFHPICFAICFTILSVSEHPLLSKPTDSSTEKPSLSKL